MSKSIRFLLTACIAIGFATPSVRIAEAGLHHHSGDVCQVATGSETNDISHGNSGAYNTNAAARWIYCPIMGIGDPSLFLPSELWVYYYDGSASTQVKCQFWGRSQTGTGYVSAFEYSQPAHVPPWTTTSGANLADVGYDYLYWVNPLGTTALDDIATVTVKCYMNNTDKLMGYTLTD